MTSPDEDRVLACLEHVDAAVQSVADFENKTVLVLDEDEAMDRLSGLKHFPAAAIVYEGLRRVQQNATGGGRSAGHACELVISIMVINQSNSLIKTDMKVPTIKLLTKLRNVLLDTRSPSGHAWEFLVEAPAEGKKNMVFWVQRWTTPLILATRPR